MRLQYNGIVIAGTGAPVAISATALPAWDALPSETRTKWADLTVDYGRSLEQQSSALQEACIKQALRDYSHWTPPRRPDEVISEIAKER